MLLKLLQIQMILLYLSTFIFVSNCANNAGRNSWGISPRSFLKFPPDVIEDGRLTTGELITKYGYPAEEHYVTTEDGYILGVFRIKKDGGQPFLLQHGLLDSSSTYILMGPKIGLGYLLWDLGYDVWIGNARGNRYSRNHTTFDPDEKIFWQFSWHEIGYFDLPAMIDYVLNVTEYPKLYYTGHSQGTTVFWVMCSKRPEYNDKIILMQALAPVAYVGHIKTPILKMLPPFTETAIRALGINEFLPNGKYKEPYCFGDEANQNFGMDILFMLAGKNIKEFNRTMFPAVCSHVPAGAATNQMVHYYQLMKSGKFCEYDYGRTTNRKKYGSNVPPKYDLSKVTAPVVLHYSLNDLLCDPGDVSLLYNQLGNTVGKYLAPTPEFNHIDFVWAIHVRTLLYDRFIRIMNDFSNGNLTNVVE